MEVDDQSSRRRGNSQCRKFIRHDHVQGHERLFRDCFAENPVYPSNLFRRRFRMSRPLFLRILNEVESYDPYFVQRRDNVGGLGIGESTAMESLKKFSETVVTVFSEEYLRSPTANDIARLLAVGEQRGFPGMLGSIDCMHWKWKNCPAAWKGMYSGHIREPTIILEAVASYDLWIWHAFFGMPGSHNDINVLERSFIFTELAQGRAPPVNYTINGNDYTMGYYLADGIYPKWRTFVKTIPSPECLNIEYDQLDDNLPELSRNHTTELTDFIQRHHDIRDSSAHHQLQEDIIEHQWLLHSQH
ncbi:uncharacterized protein LOC122289333 [Carya illinoinensis]|uniref:uncharacterized protein LOC122289333 n=1 Tax=Carya illinoinensis TaxID=32201 RepID=UPI001C7286FB|nr:uncharacterized protein LOC122289333 [Carya illinoinensis]